VTLEEARERARELRKQVIGGLDPVAERRAARAATLAALGPRKSYREVAIECHRSLAPSFRNPKHGAQWMATQETYVFPVFGHLPVDQVDTIQVLHLLRPIWDAKPETASRLRGRIQKVLDYAKVCGYRAGDNPAAWTGNIKFALPPPRKIRAIEHHSAMPIDEVAGFVRRLRDLDTVASRALEFLILTATRSGEVRLAQPSEFNLKARLWTIRGERMKAGLAHKVPLSDRAIEILMAANIEAIYIFPGRKPSQPLSENTLSKLMRTLEVPYVPHGFRSTFKDWARTRAIGLPDEVSELVLAHVNSDATRAAYARDELISKRIEILTEWSASFIAITIAGHCCKSNLGCCLIVNSSERFITDHPVSSCSSKTVDTIPHLIPLPKFSRQSNGSGAE
jgi:integrase